MAEHNEFGRQGEQMAAAFLVQRGYRILARNYRYLKAEVDLIALKEDTLSIIEVKSRTSGFLGDITDALTRKKIALLTSAADHFVQEKGLDVDVRFDVITVIKVKGKHKIEHLQNAYYHF